MALKANIVLETSTIIKQDLPYIAGSKQECIPFSRMTKLKFLKVRRIKSIKSINFFFSFILEFFFLINK